MSSPARIRFQARAATEPTNAELRERVLADPGFGRTFTDHLVSIEWNAQHGWHDAELRPYAPLPFDPDTVFLHYAQGVFEGLKAFHRPGGGVAVFRPDAHARRFQRSAQRLALPELPEATFIEAIELLVRHDHAWIPSGPEQSLYLRPFMYASDVGLGVRAAERVTFLLVASPSGSYFPRGVEPVSVWLCEDYTRAAHGGTGEAKCGGNYAGSLLAQVQAARAGCDSVVWLDATEHEWLEELSGMNLFLVAGRGSQARLVTPELTGTFVAGITRDSLLQLGADLGYGVEERRVSVDEWRRGCADGSLAEAFACGTAAVITPVGEVRSASRGSWTVGDGGPGPITLRLRQALVDIQRGAVPDQYGWMHAVPAVGQPPAARTVRGIAS